MKINEAGMFAILGLAFFLAMICFSCNSTQEKRIQADLEIARMQYREQK